MFKFMNGVHVNFNILRSHLSVFFQKKRGKQKDAPSIPAINLRSLQARW